MKRNIVKRNFVRKIFDKDYENYLIVIKINLLIFIEVEDVGFFLLINVIIKYFCMCD